jgi:cytosine/adenosine deaminase-related metal-dependent hydrolase
MRPDKLGTLEAGKLADIIVLDKDYMTIAEDDISTIEPQITVFDGKIVFVHPRFATEYNFRPDGAVISTTKDLRARRNAQGGGGG